MNIELNEMWADQSIDGGATHLRFAVGPGAYAAATDGNHGPLFVRIAGPDGVLATAEVRLVAGIKQKAILEVVALHSADFEPPSPAPFASLFSASQEPSDDMKGMRLVGGIWPSSVAIPEAGEWAIPQGLRQVHL